MKTAIVERGSPPAALLKCDGCQRWNKRHPPEPVEMIFAGETALVLLLCEGCQEAIRYSFGQGG